MCLYGIAGEINENHPVTYFPFACDEELPLNVLSLSSERRTDLLKQGNTLFQGFTEFMYAPPTVRHALNHLYIRDNLRLNDFDELVFYAPSRRCFKGGVRLPFLGPYFQYHHGKCQQAGHGSLNCAVEVRKLMVHVTMEKGGSCDDLARS